MGFTTRQIHSGVQPDPVTGSILTPIYQTTTYVQPSVDEYLSKGYSYSRSANPTVRALEHKLADLEGGADCTCYATGMAAINAVFLAYLNAGDHCIISDVAYGGTYRLATKIYSRFGVEFSFVNTADSAAVEAAMRDNTALVLTETPANPTLKLTDLAAVSALDARPRYTARGGQHFSDAVLSAPAGTGCRPRRAQHDQVFRWAQCNGGRRGGRGNAGS
jgi:cystathionine gamma-lyase